MRAWAGLASIAFAACAATRPPASPPPTTAKPAPAPAPLLGDAEPARCESPGDRQDQPPGGIEGVLLDAAGRPLVAATVIVQGPSGERAELTDDDGFYSIRGLPPGAYRVRAYYMRARVRDCLVVLPGKIVRFGGRVDTHAVGIIVVPADAPAFETMGIPAVDSPEPAVRKERERRGLPQH